jgi:aminoglycoside phosphotransferase (APT) family kinase protein
VLRREQFFSAAIRKTTRLISPWPYEIDTLCDLLPYPYAVMPRLSGQTFWWSEDQDWSAIGVALAEAAVELHRPEWPRSGEWNPETNDIVPSVAHCRQRIDGLIEQIATTSNPLDKESRRWIEEQLTPINDAPDAGRIGLIHGDLVIGNVCMELIDDRWSVTGVFDLENSRIGDPEEDLAGHLWWACYGGRPEAATSFIRRYAQEYPISARLPGYLIVRLLANWEFGRRNHEPWYGDAQTFAEWAKPLRAAVDRVMADSRDADIGH